MNYIIKVSTKERGELKYGYEGPEPTLDEVFLARIQSLVGVKYNLESITEISKEEFDALNKKGNYFSDIW